MLLSQGLRSGKYIGMVCIPANFCCCFCFGYVGLLSTATEVSKSWQPWWRAITKKWTQVVWGCYKHRVQTFVLWYCATKSVAFFWIFFPILFPRRGSITIGSCSCIKTASASIDSLGVKTFLLKSQNKKKAEKLKTRHRYGFTHVIYRMRNRTPLAAAAAAQQIWIHSLKPVGETSGSSYNYSVPTITGFWFGSSVTTWSGWVGCCMASE